MTQDTKKEVRAELPSSLIRRGCQRRLIISTEMEREMERERERDRETERGEFQAGGAREMLPYDKFTFSASLAVRLVEYEYFN